MTGAALPDTADTIIRYEDVELRAGLATLTTDEIKQGQNIHYKGRDKKQGDLVAKLGSIIDAALIGFLASVGKSQVLVRELPKVVILSSGDKWWKFLICLTPFKFAALIIIPLKPS